MPNWCNNTLTLSHEDPAEIARAAAAFQSGCFLQELVPNPTGEWDYDWCVSHWGTKWDVGGSDCAEPSISEDGCAMDVSFDSAWAPPVDAYLAMTQQGFGVHAMYYEPGCAFCGIWSDGYDDFYDMSGMSANAVDDSIPQDLNEYFAIAENMREWEDPEPLTEWYVEGAKEKGLLNDKGEPNV